MSSWIDGSLGAKGRALARWLVQQAGEHGAAVAAAIGVEDAPAPKRVLRTLIERHA